MRTIALEADPPVQCDRPLLTPLDALETTSPLPDHPVYSLSPEEALGVSFRHSGWAARRVKTYDTMCHAIASPRRLGRFASCGCHAWVQECVTTPGKYRIIADKCRDRWCEPCQREYRHKVAANVVARCRNLHLRFLTLTLRSVPGPLKPQLTRLYRSWYRLRQSRKLKHLIRGGITFLECSRNEKTNLWHPHLHVLFAGGYVPKELLSAEWHRITGDSFVVDVRSIRDSAVAAGYVSKYAAKLVPAHVRDRKDAFQEVIEATVNLRTFNTFGTFTGLKLATREPDGETWAYLYSLDELQKLCRAGIESARQIADYLMSPLGHVQEALDFGEIHPPPF